VIKYRQEVIFMLKKFTVRNYKGFKEEISIDFSKYREYQFNKHVIKHNLLNMGVIYGKNGAGKTNFGLALFDITLHLVDKQKSMYEYSNYLNASSADSSARFSYQFVFDNQEVTYNYQKKDAEKLVFEELYIGDQKVFSYNYNTHASDLENMNLVDAETLQIDKENITISLLRYIKNNTIQDKQSILSKLFEFVNNMLWFRSLGQNEYIGYKSGIDFIMTSIIKNGRIRDYEAFLNKAGINLKLEVRRDATGQEMIFARFGQKLLVFWDIISNGTQALTLFYFWSQELSNISFLFIDEFDAFYHTELAEVILQELSQKAVGQVFLTTHNTALMSNNILRPDCYFVLANNKLTSLPDCTEKELREGHNLEKMYRNGDFRE
jgi:AAA15 family ATPase/GTPase